MKKGRNKEETEREREMSAAQITEKVEDVLEKLKEDPEQANNIIRGVPKSGRPWKEPQKQRASARIAVKPLKKSWKKKMEEREQKRAMKERARAFQDQIKKEKDEARQRSLERKKMREEQERKGEVVQAVCIPALFILFTFFFFFHEQIRDTRKLKHMKRNQLRLLQKR